MFKINALALSAIILLVANGNLFAQNNVGIGIQTPDPSALLHLESNTMGVLVPRLTAAQRTALANPANGLLVFDTDSACFFFYRTTPVTGWQNLCTTTPSSSSLPTGPADGDLAGAYPNPTVDGLQGNPVSNVVPDSGQALIWNGANWAPVTLPADSNLYWKLTGNDSVDATHFLGTINNASLNFRVNNIHAGKIDPVTKDVLLGVNAGRNYQGGITPVIAIGNAAYASDTGGMYSWHNMAIGDSALFHAAPNVNGGQENMAIGDKAMFHNTLGVNNVAVGLSALQNNTTGAVNTAIGNSALYNNTDGAYNTAVGMQPLYDNQSGYYNTAVGVSALHHSANTHDNTAVGHEAMSGNLSGVENAVVGSMAMTFGQQGSYNTVMGYSALSQNKTGYSNVVIGHTAAQSNKHAFAIVAIGAGALGGNDTMGTNYTVAIGDSALFNNRRDFSVFNSGLENTAVGSKALFSNTHGQDNTSLGFFALHDNTVGDFNTAVGAYGLYHNTTGEGNTALGMAALETSTTGSYNTAVGQSALVDNTTGSNNTAIGAGAFPGGSGSFNTAVGMAALSSTIGNPSTASGNTAVGYRALEQATAGSNIAIGYLAAKDLQAQSGNTVVGYNAGNGNFKKYSFSVLIGYNAGVSDTFLYTNQIAIGRSALTTASDQARIGNATMTSIGGFADWTNLSDGRYKRNIRENIPGIEFVKSLRPVSYNMDVEAINRHLHIADSLQDKQAVQHKSQIVYTGFIAQEVEAAAEKLGFDFSGVDAPKNENDLYGLRYAEFVVPLVKAMQEQQQIIEQLSERIKALEERN